MNKYKILNLIQGSDEWLKKRLEFLCASEASAVMNESKFMSRNQLLDLKKGWLSNPNSSFKEMLFEKGHEHEAMARPIFEFEECEDFPPIVASFEVDINGGYLTLLASFDGLGADCGAVWEHKDWNLILSENIRNGVLEPTNYWQLEHQMLVAGVKEATITCSDGTIENKVSMIYKSVPSRRKDLINASSQFMVDLQSHELEVKIESFEKERKILLPSITYDVSGTEITSNILSCLAKFKDQATFEISRTLESDQDFADKDKMNKAVIKARADLKEKVKNAKNKFVSFSEFAEVAEEIDKILQKMQSHGVKQVQLAKSNKKNKIKNLAELDVANFTKKVNEVINPIQIQNIYTQGIPDFDIAMKGKRTIESLQNAVDSSVAKLKVEVNEIKDLVLINLRTLRELAAGYEGLFMDTPQLVIKDNESLIAIIKIRISDEKQKQKQKDDDRREEIRIEEEEKARKKIADEEERVKAINEVKRLEEEIEAKTKSDFIQQNENQSKKVTEKVQFDKDQLEHHNAEVKRDQFQEDIVDGKFKYASNIIGNHAINNDGSAKSVEQRLSDRFKDDKEEPIEQSKRSIFDDVDEGEFSPLRKSERFNRGSHYQLISNEGEATVVYFYLNPDANCFGFGFNIADGGGFLPESDLHSDSEVNELVITVR